MKTQKLSGFTLFELLGVIVIVIILGALILPTLQRVPDKYRGLSSTERTAARMLEHLREVQKINFRALDLPQGSRAIELEPVEPVESAEDIYRSTLIHPKFKPDSLNIPAGNLNLWLLNPTNIPIKLP